MSHTPSFSEYVSEFHADVFSAALGILRNPEDASDVTQQVFMAVAEGRLNLDAARDPRALLRWSAGKHSLSHLRSEQRRRRREEVHAMESTNELGTEMSDEDLRSLWDAVASLPDKFSAALVLRFRENLSFESIGETLACSKGTAFERVQQGLQRLKQRLPQGAMGIAGLESALSSPSTANVPAGLEPRLLELGQAIQTTAAVGSTSFMGVSSFLLWASGAAAVALLTFGLGLWPFNREATHQVDPNTESTAYTSEASSSVPANVPAADAVEPLRTEAFQPEANESASPVRVSSLPEVDAPATATLQIIGRINDDRGQPIEGANVVLRSIAMKGKDSVLYRAGMSDADGAFRLEVSGYTPGLSCRLQVNCASFVVYQHPKRLKLEGSTIDVGALVLQPVVHAPRIHWSAKVQVLGDDSIPVANAEVKLSREMGAAEIPGVQWTVAKSRTDENGYATVQGPRGGKFQLSAWREGYTREVEAHTVEGAGPFEWIIRLKRGWSLHGTVVDTQGQPLEQAFVGMKVGSDQRRHWTKADGRFEFRGLGAPPWKLLAMGVGKSEVNLVEVTPRDRGFQIILKDQDDPRDIGMHDAELHGWWTHPESGAKLPLKSGSSSVARVPEGASLADWLPLQLTPMIVQTASTMFEVAPRDDGWHHTGLKSGRYIVFCERWKEGFTATGPFNLESQSILSNLRVPLHKPRTVRGVVLGPNGDPAVNAEIFPVGHGPLTDALILKRDQIVMEEGGEGSRHWRHIAKTDAQGRFELQVPTILPENVPLYLAAIHANFRPAIPCILSNDLEKAVEFRLMAR